MSKMLNIKEAYLSAIEAGKMELVPSKTYFVGFVKSYANTLGVDIAIPKDDEYTTDDPTFKKQTLLYTEAMLPSWPIFYISAFTTFAVYFTLYMTI